MKIVVNSYLSMETYCKFIVKVMDMTWSRKHGICRSRATWWLPSWLSRWRRSKQNRNRPTTDQPKPTSSTKVTRCFSCCPAQMSNSWPVGKACTRSLNKWAQWTIIWVSWERLGKNTFYFTSTHLKKKMDWTSLCFVSFCWSLPRTTSVYLGRRFPHSRKN